MIVKGNTTSKRYALSILASSYSHTQCKKFFGSYHVEGINGDEVDYQLKLGRKKFQSSRKNFESILAGLDLPSTTKSSLTSKH